MRAICIALAGALFMAPSSGALAQFTQTYFDQTSGRVGYHMSVGYPLTPKTDVPKGNTGGAISGSCGSYMNLFAYNGELPPGLKFVNQGDIVFSGTPRQPGTWQGSVSAEIYCSGGPDLTRYSRTIPVTWRIEP